MSFGQELKDFAGGFKTGYDVVSDSKDRKFKREQAELNGPIDRDYKKASTESLREQNKWYTPMHEAALRTAESNLKWADRDHQSLIEAREASTYRDVVGNGRTKAAIPGVDDDNAPDLSTGPTVGDHAASALPDTEAVDTPDTAPAPDDTDPAQTNGIGDQSSLDNTWLKYANADATRDLPIAPKLANGMSFLKDMGVQMVVFSGGQPSSGPNRVGSHRHDNGMAADVTFVKDGRKLDWANPQDVPLFKQIVAKAEQNGVTGFGAGPGYMKEGSMHVGYGKPAVWGAGGSGANAPDWLRQASLGYARGGMVTSALPVEVRAARGGAIPALADPNDPDVDGDQDQPGVPDQDQPTAGLMRIQVADAAPAPQQAPQQVPQQALPVDGPIPESRPAGPDVTPEGKPDVGYDPSVADEPKVAGYTTAHEAVLDGMRYSLQQMGLDKGAAIQDPDRAAKMAEYLKGAGAAPKAVIDQAYDVIDKKNGKLPESERTMAALATTYDYYMKRGEPDKAKAAAASIVQYQRKLFQQYSAITKAAIQAGDMDGAAKSAIKAYSSVPDGQEATVKKTKDGRYQVEIKDEATGKTISNPVYTPQEIGAWAMQVNPGSFDQFIMDAAGVRKQKSTVPSDDFQKLASGIDEGKIPTNEMMAKLPMEEQKELRLRANDYATTKAKADASNPESPAYAKPPTRTEIDAARTATKADWDSLEGETDENGQPLHKLGGLTPTDTKAITDAAGDIFVTPKNITADYSVSPRDANEAAFTVAQSDNYTSATDRGGMKIQLPDGRDVWIPMERFQVLKGIYKRNVADTKKKAADDLHKKEDANSASIKAGVRDRDIMDKSLLGDTSIPSPLIGQSQSAIDDLQKLMGQ